MATARVTQREVREGYQTLYEVLNGEAYWAASTIETKDRIHGLAEAVFGVLTELNRADLARRTAEFNGLRESVKGVNEKLEKLKADIQAIIHKVELAARVAEAIDKAIDLAGQFFA